MISSIKLLFVGVLVLAISACVHQPALKPVANWNQYQQQLGAIDQWQFEGRLALKAPGSADTPRIAWKQNPNDYAIRLWGAFGLGNTWIYGNGSGVRIEQAGNDTAFAPTPEQLVYDTLGYDIPVKNLRYWVKGIPAPDVPVDSIKADSNGLVEEMQQSGWSLTFDRYEPVARWNLPGRIVARRDDIRLTLRVSEWHIDAD